MKKLNVNLIKHTIKTDFFLLENEKTKQTKQLKSLSNKNYFLLDVIELNFSLKQFIRVLQFAKKNNNDINFVNSNKQHLKILKAFFLKNKSEIKNHFFFCERALKKKDFTLSKNIDLNILVNNRNNEDLLTCEINTIIKLFSCSKYKIFNDLNSFKKLIFFISVIKNVLKN